MANFTINKETLHKIVLFYKCPYKALAGGQLVSICSAYRPLEQGLNPESSSLCYSVSHTTLKD
jgi:hypothetical protein